MPHQLTEREIIVYAARAGFVLTSDQLKRWRKARLFPRPSRHGLGRGKGTVSRYPDGAERWAVDLARELARKRDLSLAAWHLWLKGYPLTDHARRHIARVLPRLIAAFNRWELGELDLKSTLAKRSRKHPVVSAGARMLAGRPSSASELRATEQHLPALPNGPGDTPVENLLDDLKATGQGLSLLEWGTALASVPDATLEQVRDEVLLKGMVLDAVGQGEPSVTSPVDILLWFGLTRVAPGGKLAVAFIRSAFEEGRIPQLVAQLRELVPYIRSVREMSDSIFEGR